MAKEMSKEAKAAKNEYYRRWRARNPDKVRESNRKYWENKVKKEALNDGE